MRTFQLVCWPLFDIRFVIESRSNWENGQVRSKNFTTRFAQFTFQFSNDNALPPFSNAVKSHLFSLGNCRHLHHVKITESAFSALCPAGVMPVMSLCQGRYAQGSASGSSGFRGHFLWGDVATMWLQSTHRQKKLANNKLRCAHWTWAFLPGMKNKL